MRVAVVAGLSLIAVACGPGARDLEGATPVVEDCAVGLDPGTCPPDFTLPDADGTPVSLSAQVGTPVLVVGSSFW